MRHRHLGIALTDPRGDFGDFLDRRDPAGRLPGLSRRRDSWHVSGRGTAPTDSMNEQQQLHELEALASGLSVRVCYETMGGLVQGVGGLCRVRGEYRVIIDRRLKSAERLAILADALRRFDFERSTLSPQLRDLLAN